MASIAGDSIALPLDVLESLIDQGLLRAIASAEGEPRFIMLETTREYALERLAEGETEEHVRRAHADHFRAFAASMEPGLMSADPDPWFNRTEADIANLRAALAWLRDQGEIEAALDLAGSLSWFWTMPTYIAEGRSWYDMLLAMAGSDVDQAVMARAMDAAGDLADWHTDTNRAVELHERALSLWREMGAQRQIAASLRSLGSAAIDQFAFTHAEGLLREALTLATETGDTWNVAATSNLLGVTSKELGAYEDAAQWHEEALRTWRRLGDNDHLPSALNSIGWAYFLAGEHQRAWESWDATISLGNVTEAESELATALFGFAALASRNDQASSAIRLFAAATTQRRQLGIPLRPPTQALIDHLEDESRKTLGSAAFALAWNEGHTLSIGEAVHEARSVRVPPPTSDDGLSRREREVLALLVEGAPDHDIADQLFITRRTASKHVAAILEKLGASNRTAAATIAHRRGLV